jgi:DNA-binding CsgD family transcriptional regulator
MAQRGRPRSPTLLTPREQEVLDLIRAGRTNAEIGEALGITVETVKQHVSQVLDKLGVESREEAAAWREERRRWWAALPRWALVGTAGAVLVALGVLALGVWLASRADDEKDNISSGGPKGYIAFAAPMGRTDGYDLWLVNADGTGARRLVELEQPAGISNVRWSGDGNTVKFHVDVGGNNVSHWDYVTDLAGNWTRTETTSNEDPNASWRMTVDDNYAFVTGPDDARTTTILNLQGYVGATSPNGSQVAAWVGAQELPDGSAGGNGDMNSVYVSDPGGAEFRRLITEFGYTAPTDWSPDGTWLALNCAPEFWQGHEGWSVPPPNPGAPTPLPMGLCLIHPDGTGMVRLASGCNAKWSADGKWLIYAHHGTLRTIRTEGSDDHELFASGGGANTFAWYDPGREAENAAVFNELC